MITFNAFLHTMREQLGIYQSTLADGICSESFLSRIESGERKASQLLREYLLGRLNTPTGNFHDYLQAGEYEDWRLRQNIIYALLCKDIKRAEELLNRYEASLEADDKISGQFCIYARIQMKLISGEARKNLLYLYEEGVMCSMRHLTRDFAANFEGALLCLQEYCILLEYITAKAFSFGPEDKVNAGAELKKIELILERVEKGRTNYRTESKIYPLGACLYATAAAYVFEGEESVFLKRAKEYCFKAIDYLRSSARTYYYKEIVEFLETASNLSEGEQDLLKEYRHFYDVLEGIYGEYSVDFATLTSAYIFVERGAYSIGNVIVKRRRMLGITQKDLGEGICSEKTLYRIENGKSAVQDYTFKLLFERLKLVPEYVHGEIIADNTKAFELYRQAKRINNNTDYKELRENLIKLRETMQMDCDVNRQCWSRMWNNMLRATGEISDEQYCNNIRKLINISIDEMDETETDSLFFNDAEIMLIHNLSILDTKNRRKYLMLVVGAIDSEKEIVLMTHFNLNAFILSYYASELGNERNFRKSDEVSIKINDMGLRLGNIRYLADNLYNKYWNGLMLGNAPRLKLRECLEISRFIGDSAKERFFEAKLSESGYS